MREHPLVRRARLLFTTNLPYKILSVLIALALWFIVRDERVETAVIVPLEVQAPGDLIVSNEHLPDLTVTVTGTRAALSRMRAQSVTYVARPKTAEPGMLTLRIRPEDIELPPGVQAVSVSPPAAAVRLEARATRRVPVRARLLVAEGTGFKVRRVTVTPERVRVAGPTSVVAGLDEVWTEAIEVAPRGTEPISGQYALSLPHRQLRVEDAGPVTVRIEIEEAPSTPAASPTPAGLKVNGAGGPKPAGAEQARSVGTGTAGGLATRQ